ncbi:type II toxin-antitoxin system RelE/ParE family toxin [Kaistella sp.]|uniref:type II toxin-antitoxin system RelE/ParE family toxin n=1 Tax=Kaistella sp. TaxID=2782235 RepID=UPI003C3F1E11
MFRVLISKNAKFDLKDCSDFYGSISKGLKSKFLLNFNKALEELKEFPYFQLRYDEFRMRQVNAFPVMIHYIVFEEKKIVKIYGVRFAKANPENYPKV